MDTADKATQRVKQLVQQPQANEGVDLALGIPLEHQGRTIYPVFANPGPSAEPDAHPRQIGYLELSEGRSDYTSLEADNRPIALVPMFLLAIILIWFLRRRRTA